MSDANLIRSAVAESLREVATALARVSDRGMTAGGAASFCDHLNRRAAELESMVRIEEAAGRRTSIM